MTKLQQDQEVLVYERGKQWTGKVVKVARKLVHIKYGGVVLVFRIDSRGEGSGSANDAYGREYYKTLERAALDARRKDYTTTLAEFGVVARDLGSAAYSKLTTEQLEALAWVVNHVREGATDLGLDHPDQAGWLLGDCSCGASYRVRTGPHEGNDLDEAQDAHVAQALKYMLGAVQQ